MMNAAGGLLSQERFKRAGEEQVENKQRAGWVRPVRAWGDNARSSSSDTERGQRPGVVGTLKS